MRRAMRAINASDNDNDKFTNSRAGPRYLSRRLTLILKKEISARFGGYVSIFQGIFINAYESFRESLTRSVSLGDVYPRDL